MAITIRPTDISQGLTGTIQTPGLATSQGFGALASGMRAVGRPFTQAALDMQLRRNEGMVNEGLVDFGAVRHSMLYGDGAEQVGVMNVKDAATVRGSTKMSSDQMEAEIKRIADRMENGVQRDAFMEQASPMLMRAIDVMSKHEADVLEKTRVASSQVRTDTELEFLRNSDPYAFMPAPIVDGEPVREDKREKIYEFILDDIETRFPFLGEREKAMAATQRMADEAHAATTLMLRKTGPTGIADARKMLETYSDFWDNAQRETVEAAIDYEIGLNLMTQASVATQDWAAEQDEPPGLPAMRDHARKYFTERYSDPETGTGHAPPPELVEDAGERAMIDEELQRSELEYRRKMDGRKVYDAFVDALGPDTDPRLAEAAYRKAWDDTGDADIRDALDTRYSSWKDGDKKRTDKRTRAQIDAIDDKELRRLQRDPAKMAVWEAVLGADSIEYAYLRERVNGTGAADQYKGEIENAVTLYLQEKLKREPKKDETAQYKPFLADQLRVWQRQNDFPPGPDDWDRMLDAADRSLDDPGIPWAGFEGTIREFLATGEGFDTTASGRIRGQRDAALAAAIEDTLRATKWPLPNIPGVLDYGDYIDKTITRNPEVLQSLMREILSNPEYLPVFLEKLDDRGVDSGE